MICATNNAAQQKTFALKNEGGRKKGKRAGGVESTNRFSVFLHAPYMTRVAGRRPNVVTWQGTENETVLRKVSKKIATNTKIVFGKLPKDTETLVKYAHLFPENYI